MRRPSAYRVFLTRSSEYHVRGRVCLGVRDRRTGAWSLGHPALRGRIASVGPEGRPQSVGTPVIGECLWFVGGEQPVQTSPVLAVEEREALALGDGILDAMRCVPPPARAPRHTR
jgi:hypothetical protein